MHPAHVEYLREMPLNTLAYFFGVLTEVDTGAHPDIIRHLFHHSLPRCGFDDASGTFAMPEVTPENIRAFSERCRRAAEVISEPAVIKGLVVSALADMQRIGDLAAVEESKSRWMRMAERGLRGELGDVGPMPDETVDWIVEHMEHLPEKTAEAHRTYVYFCEKVVLELLKQ